MRQQQGFALIATVLIGLVLFLLVLGASVSGLIDRGVSANQQLANTAYFAAQAGLYQADSVAFHNLVDGAHPADPLCKSAIEIFLDTDGNYVLWVTDSSGSTVSTNTLGGTLDNGATYTVTVSGSSESLVFKSVGTYYRGKATITQVVTPTLPGNVWSNAIFADRATPGSNQINGNVSVFGSVQIVDANVQFDESALTTGGTAGMFNNYFGDGSHANSIIANTVSDYIGQSFGGYDPNTPPDLCARLKVNKGSVYLTSASTLGSTYDLPGTEIYSVNLGAGNLYTGNLNNPTLVTDWNNAQHSAGNRVSLRYPPDPPGNPVGPYGPYATPFPTDYTSSAKNHRGLTITYNTTDGTVSATGYPDPTATDSNPAGTASSDDCSWLYSSTSGGFQVPPADSQAHTCSDGNGDHINWVVDPTDPQHPDGYLDIGGNVNLLDTGGATLNITPSGGNTPVAYKGQGTLRVGIGWNGSDVEDNGSTSAINMSGLLVPYNQSAGDGGFPDPDGLSFVTPGDLTDDQPTNSVTAFLAYVGGTATFKGGSYFTLLGSVVAHDVDIINTVPNIAYVPGVATLADAQCLPGSPCDISKSGLLGGGVLYINSTERH